MSNKKIIIALSVLAGFFFLTTMTVVGLYFFVVNKDEMEEDVVTTSFSSDTITDLESVDESDHLALNDYLSGLPMEDLSDDEIEGLLLMREEEKLAHDVYTTLYEVWGQRIFTNIARSEQTHTDSVADILAKYGLEDPVVDTTVGVFENEMLQGLYNDLVEKGSASITEAMTVGAIVEDLDIHDLDLLMAETDNADILAVYQNLLKGSRNHMRSFTRMLNRNGATYTPEYISQQDYDEIIGTASENGVTYDENGDVIDMTISN